jgi:hypothetical protein
MDNWVILWFGLLLVSVADTSSIDGSWTNCAFNCSWELYLRVCHNYELSSDKKSYSSEDDTCKGTQFNDECGECCSWSSMRTCEMPLDVWQGIIDRNSTLALYCTRFVNSSLINSSRKAIRESWMARLTRRHCEHIDLGVFSIADSKAPDLFGSMHQITLPFIVAFLQNGKQHCLYQMVLNTFRVFSRWKHMGDSERLLRLNNASTDVNQTVTYLKKLGTAIGAYDQNEVVINSAYYGQIPYIELFSKLSPHEKAVVFLRSAGINRDLNIHITKNDIKEIFEHLPWIDRYEHYIDNMIYTMKQNYQEYGPIFGRGKRSIDNLDSCPTALDMYSSITAKILVSLSKYNGISPIDRREIEDISYNFAYPIGISASISGIFTPNTKKPLTDLSLTFDKSVTFVQKVRLLHKCFQPISLQSWLSAFFPKFVASASKSHADPSLYHDLSLLVLAFLGPGILEKSVYDNLSRKEILFIISMLDFEYIADIGALANELESMRQKDTKQPLLQSEIVSWSDKLTPLMFLVSMDTTKRSDIYSTGLETINSWKMMFIQRGFFPVPASIDEELASVNHDVCFLFLNYWRIYDLSNLPGKFYREFCNVNQLGYILSSLRPLDLPILEQLFLFLHVHDIMLGSASKPVVTSADIQPWILCALRRKADNEDQLLGLIKKFHHLFPVSSTEDSYCTQSTIVEPSATHKEHGYRDALADSSAPSFNPQTIFAILIALQSIYIFAV